MSRYLKGLINALDRLAIDGGSEHYKSVIDAANIRCGIGCCSLEILLSASMLDSYPYSAAC